MTPEQELITKLGEALLTCDSDWILCGEEEQEVLTHNEKQVMNAQKLYVDYVIRINK